MNEQNIWMLTEDPSSICKPKSVIQKCTTHLCTDQNPSKSYRQEIFFFFFPLAIIGISELQNEDPDLCIAK